MMEEEEDEAKQNNEKNLVIAVMGDGEIKRKTFFSVHKYQLFI